MKANEMPDRVYIHKSPFWGLMANEHNITKNGIEYTRTDAFIEKASEWFKIRYEWIDIDGTRNYDMSAFEDFKNYMKDESYIYLSEYD